MSKVQQPENMDMTFIDSESISFVLFAQDLVGYVISNCIPSFKMPLIIENIPQHFKNPFNCSVKNAVNCILFYVHRKNRYCFKHLAKAIGDEIPAKYIKSLKKLEDNYFSIWFTMTNFLYYCVDIAVMSAAFFSIGMEEAPEMAVMYILITLKRYHTRGVNIAALYLVADEFPFVSSISFTKAQKRLKEDLKLSLSPLKEISESSLNEESCETCSEVETKLVNT